MIDALGLLDESQKKNIEWNKDNPWVNWADATNRIPVEDRSVEVLYTSHMVEHLDHDDLDRFLREALRVLIPGGILRVVVPDLSKIVNDYTANGDADDFFRRLNVSSGKSPKTLVQRLRWLIVGSRDHVWMYDGPSLCRLLERHGFQHPIILPAGQTTIATPGSLDLSERSDESVYVEASAP